MRDRKMIWPAAIATLLLLAASPAGAQQRDAVADYPNRTIKILVSAPPGGGPDIAARMIAEKLRQRWGQPVVVENRQGNAGNVGAEAVAAAEPDGYTLLAAQPAPLTTNGVLYKKLNFDPAAFEPILVMTAFPNLLLVRRDLPAKSAEELIAYAKANPGKLNFASQGIGTTPHLTGELFGRMIGGKLVHVPYRGTAQAVNDIAAGHVDMMFLELSASYELHKGGRARILAAATKERLPVLPDVPTLQELGLADFLSLTWNAMAAPPKTPPAIVGKINAAINEIFRTPEMQAHFAALNMQPVGGTPAETRTFLRAETERWGAVIRAANITVE
jgi:tripartite-type tricarboxylate transporter receptor subunit TctC